MFRQTHWCLTSCGWASAWEKGVDCMGAANSLRVIYKSRYLLLALALLVTGTSATAGCSSATVRPVPTVPLPTPTPTSPVVEFPLPHFGSDPGSIATGPDDAVWFTEIYNSAIGRIS